MALGHSWGLSFPASFGGPALVQPTWWGKVEGLASVRHMQQARAPRCTHPRLLTRTWVCPAPGLGCHVILMILTDPPPGVEGVCCQLRFGGRRCWPQGLAKDGMEPVCDETVYLQAGTTAVCAGQQSSLMPPLALTPFPFPG